MKSQVGMYFPPLNNRLSLKKDARQTAGVRKTVKEQLNYFTASVRRGW